MEGVSRPVGKRPSRRAYLLITLFAFALVLLPFWFWYDTWFGRKLTDAKLEQYLTDTNKPRRAQQALVQIVERLNQGDESVRRWYPKVMDLASHSSAELRQTAAWIMGQDTRHAPFRSALLQLLNDPSILVRRNAALALAAFRDPAGRPVLRDMLRSYTLTAEAGGQLKYRLKVGEYVNPGTLVARADGQEIRSPLPGEIRQLLQEDESKIRPGDPVADLGPDDKHVWEALRALYLVGQPEDLDDVRRHLRSARGGSNEVHEQARLTVQSIESRAR